MADALGIVAGVLGIISFILGQAPQNDKQTASVEIRTGYAQDPNTGDREDSPDGTFANLWGFNPANEEIGHVDLSGTHFDAGQYHTFKLPTSGGQQPEYLDLSVTNDAVCLAWMAVTYPSDVNSATYSLLGDFFEFCDLGDNPAEWYYGGVIAGKEDNGDNHYVDCGWMDADHTNGHRFGSLKARMPVFHKQDGDDNKNYYCYPPSLQFAGNTDEITKREHARDVTMTNVVRRGGTRGDNSLVKSDISQYTATRLCSSRNSAGPDYISLKEGLYCDMTTRELHKICSLNNLTEDCLELDVLGKSISGLIGGKSISKTFSRVVEWWEE